MAAVVTVAVALPRAAEMQAHLLRLADPAGAAYGAHLTPEEVRDASGPESVGGATGTPPRHTGMR